LLEETLRLEREHAQKPALWQREPEAETTVAPSFDPRTEHHALP
jgi:hypothetical protein